MSEAVDRLVAYCRENNRVCPLPKAWQQLWEMLPEKRQALGAWQPAVPLIGAAGHETPAMLKMTRLAEHIQWAAKHSALPEVAAFVRGLREFSIWANSRVTTQGHCQSSDCGVASLDGHGLMVRPVLPALWTQVGHLARSEKGRCC